MLSGSFAKKFLSDMDPEKLSLYDRLDANWKFLERTDKIN